MLKSIRRADIRIAQELIGPGQVPVDGQGPRRGKQRPRMADHHRIVVDVDHPRIRRDLLGDLMHAVHGGQPGADVEELGDAGAPRRSARPARGTCGSRGRATAAAGRRRPIARRLPGRPRSYPCRRASSRTSAQHSEPSCRTTTPDRSYPPCLPSLARPDPRIRASLRGSAAVASARARVSPGDSAPTSVRPAMSFPRSSKHCVKARARRRSPADQAAGTGGQVPPCPGP